MLRGRWKLRSRIAPAACAGHATSADRIGDGSLYGLTALAAIAASSSSFAIIWRVADGAWPAIRVTTSRSSGTTSGTRSRASSARATSSSGRSSPRSGRCCSRRRSRSRSASSSASSRRRRSAVPIGTLVDMLAAVPSVVIGLWGIFVLAPFDAQHVQPFLSSLLGWIPIFAHGQDTVESTRLHRDHRADDHDRSRSPRRSAASSSSACRPSSRKGRSALGATRWEMVKTVRRAVRFAAASSPRSCSGSDARSARRSPSPR